MKKKNREKNIIIHIKTTNIEVQSSFSIYKLTNPNDLTYEYRMILEKTLRFNKLSHCQFFQGIVCSI